MAHAWSSTEYDLPRSTIEPHDVVVDADGMVWYSDFGALFVGRMDPKTGKVTEYPIPQIKEGFPVGTLDLEFDRDGNLWVGLMYQGGVAKLDRKTGKVQTWSVPKEWQTDATQQSFASPTFSHVDGKVWVKNSDRAQILRLDPATSTWENFGTFTDPETKRTIGSYGINADRNNNLYMLDFNAANIGILNGATKKLEIFRTAIPNSRPRRGSVDSQNRLWFAEYDGNAIGVLDPSDEADQGMACSHSLVQPLRCRHRQERRGMDWIDDERPNRAARYEDRSVHGVLLPQPDEYPARMGGQLDQPGDVLGRQQSRRLHREAGAARLGRIVYLPPVDFRGGSLMAFALTVNGFQYVVDVEPETPLLWVLRDTLDLTGTKYGCGIGQCGACTVHVNGRAVRSCSLPVKAAAGATITTIEGLSADGTHPVQLAWKQLDVPQCGYCQSGMIMAAVALLQRTPAPTDDDIDDGVTNACRCGPIIGCARRFIGPRR